MRAAEFSQHLPFRRLGHEFGIFTLALSDDNDDGIVYSMSNPSEFFAQYLSARTTENPMCIQKKNRYLYRGPQRQDSRAP